MSAVHGAKLRKQKPTKLKQTYENRSSHSSGSNNNEKISVNGSKKNGNKC